jgi:adenylylsulfate reductase subunit B
MVFVYPTPAKPTPAVLPQLWWIGGLMVLVGGYWFWFFIRVDVAAEGNTPLRLMRADLFILSLVASVTFGLIWAYLQAASNTAAGVFFGLYIAATTVLFGSVPWSKFAHMFFKPAAAFEKRMSYAQGTRPTFQSRRTSRSSSAARVSYRATTDKPVTHHFGRQSMPTFVYMTRCDGCGHCVDICPSDIMHIDKTYRRAYNIEPNMCWECYSCVKACPQNAIDVRGYADFAPLGHSVRVLREEKKGTISWRLKFRDGREKNFVSPIRTTPWGSIKGPAELDAPRSEALANQELAHEPTSLKIEGGLPALRRDQLKQGVV